MDAYWIKPWKGKKPRIEKKPSDYVKANFTITISGMFFFPAFLCAYLGMGADRIAFGWIIHMKGSRKLFGYQRGPNF